MFRKAFLGLIISVFVVGCAIGPKGPTPEQIATANYGPYPGNYENIINAYLRKVLIDRDSMRDLTIERPRKIYTLRHDTTPVPIFAYGTNIRLNAKNRYGGYTGLKNQYVVIKNGKILFVEDNGPYRYYEKLFIRYP